MAKHKKQHNRPVSQPAKTEVQLKYDKAVNAVRSYYSNAVSWGTNLVNDLRNDYALDDASTARLFAIAPTAWAAANFRAGAESGIDLLVVDEAEQPVERYDNPLLWLIDNSALLLFKMSISVLLFGKYYLLKHYNQAGKPVWLEWLNPLDVSLDIDYAPDPRTQEVRPHIRGFRVRGMDNILDPRDVVYDFTFDPMNDFDGTSSYKTGLRSILGERELSMFAQKFFQDGTMLGGLLLYNGSLDDDEVLRIRKEMEQFRGSGNAFKTMILGAGLTSFDYKPVQANPADLAMNELKDSFRVDICELFGVNPVLLGIGVAKDPLSADNTYDNVYVKFILQHVIPRLKWFCQAFTTQWLKPDFPEWGDLRVMPNTEAIESASKVTVDRAQISTNVKGWTLNELREFTGRKPLPFPAIPIDPTWAMTLWTGGVIVRSEMRALVGMKTSKKYPDGFIYEVVPKEKAGAQPLSASSLYTMPSSATEPSRSLPPGEPTSTPESSNVVEAEIVKRPPIRDAPVQTKAVLYELGQWRNKVHSKGKNTPFETSCIPPAISTFVRSELDGLWNADAVFSEAKRAVSLGQVPNTLGAAQADADRYWQDYDALQHDIGAAWINYQKAISQAFNESQSTEALELAQQKNRAELLAAWVGTSQQPGTLAKILLAGLGQGEKALQEGIAANPNKRDAIPIVQLMQQDALDFIQSYAGTLIKDIDDTTLGGIRDLLAQQASGAISKDALADGIADWLVPPTGVVTPAILNRAKAISDTESARAFNGGAIERWKRGGVTKARVYTVRDDRVCPICRGLYGTVADTTVGWKLPSGKYAVPPFHPRCRDFMRPEMA